MYVCIRFGEVNSTCSNSFIVYKIYVYNIMCTLIVFAKICCLIVIPSWYQYYIYTCLRACYSLYDLYII